MARTDAPHHDREDLAMAALLGSDTSKPRGAAKKKLPLPDNGATYVWEQADADDVPVLARSEATPPRREPEPSAPSSHLRSSTSWGRMWRIFVAGAIMGVATVKAAELLLHRDR